MSLVMNGINPDAKRHPDDFYVTEPRAVIELMEALESLKIGLPPIVVDSSVGSGIIADAVQLYGHDVIGYDVEDRGWAATRLQDFLTVKAADRSSVKCYTDAELSRKIKSSLDIAAECDELAVKYGALLQWCKVQ